MASRGGFGALLRGAALRDAWMSSFERYRGEYPDLAGAMADLDDELRELKEEPSAHELGDVLFAAVNVTIQTDLMKQRHGDYSFALAVVCAVVAVALALIAWFGPEARGRNFAHEAVDGVT